MTVHYNLATTINYADDTDEQIDHEPQVMLQGSLEDAIIKVLSVPYNDPKPTSFVFVVTVVK